MSEPISAIDGPALIAAVRGGDEDAISQAYRVVFCNDLGRLVLAHHLADCGVGNALMGPGGSENLKYRAGMHDGALKLASKANFDNAAIAVAVLTDTLEETGHEESSAYNYAPSDDELDG